MEDKNISISLYDMNKSVMRQMRILTNIEIEEKKSDITKFIKENKNKFYMLLCKELGYYTLFQKENNVLLVDRIENVIFELIADYGKLHSVNVEEDHIEFWIEDDKEEMHAFMFFPYDNGVVKCQ